MSSLVAKKAARKKLLARLGVEAKSLLDQCIQGGGGTMKKNEYLMFWEQVDGPTESTWLLGEIAQKMNEQLAKGAAGANENSGGGGGGGQSSGGGVGLDSLITTFNFILLTLELLTADKKIKEVLQAWSKIELKEKALAAQHPLFTQCKEIYRMLTLRVENQELIGALILSCISMYGSIKEFERMMDILNYSTIDDYADLKGGESSFYYEHLKRLAKDGFAIPNTTTIGKTPVVAGSTSSSTTPQTPQSMLQLILQTTVSKLITLPQQMKLNPKVAETTFCALIHLLRNLMSVHAITDSKLISYTLSTLQPFYLWPNPYGIQTRELLIQLQEEALLPGSFLRTRLEQECHTTPYLETDKSASTPDQLELSSALFYLYSQDDKASQAYIGLLDLKPFKAQTLKRSPPYIKDTDGIPTLLTSTTQAFIILNLLASEPNLGSGSETDDIASMRQCNQEHVYQLYKRVQSMIRDIQDRPNESKEIRNRQLTELRHQLRTFASQSDRRDLVRLPEKLVSPFTPQLPNVAHLSIPLASTSVYEFYPRDQWRMLGLKVAPFVHVPIADELIALFTMYRDPNRLTPLTIRLMVSGGDELLHQLLCAWCAIKQTKPELLDGLSPKFYLLPFSRNHLAAFLARHDSWYNRHIYVPSRSTTFMAPWIRVDQHDMDALSGSSSSSSQSSSAVAVPSEEDAELPPPGQFFRRSFESYAREAALTCDSYIYQLEGYTSPDSEGLKVLTQPTPGAKSSILPGPDHLIPFLQRAEIGILAAAAEWKRMKRMADSVRLEEIISGTSIHSKGFEYTPIELCVKFTKMDLQGRLSEVVSEDAAVYQSLVLSNVPRKGDITSPPNPTYPNLELGARLHKSHNQQKSANLGRKNQLPTDSKQHVIEVEIWTSNPNQTFGILIDNQFFGPYHRIKLLPGFENDTKYDLTSPTASSTTATPNPNKRMKLPIQTFFPMDM